MGIIYPTYPSTITANQISASQVTGSQALVGNINIGTPTEDGTYSDGLFTDLTNLTYLSNAVDRMNEVLKGLAPKAAPALTNLERNNGVGTSMKLAFGASYPVATYTNANFASTTGLANVNFGEAYNSSLGVSGAVRMGVFAATTPLTLSLNNSVNADQGVFTNYRAKAHNVPTNGIGNYILEINGVQVSPTGSTTNISATVTQTFNLSNANSGTFLTSGEPFALFYHRTGSVGIPTSLWTNGYNYAKLSHVSSLGTTVTNYVDWIYDPTASSGVQNYTFTTPVSSSFVASGLKALSGIKYFTSIAYNFSTTVGNFYKNTYPVAGGLTIGSATTGLNAAIISIPPPTTNNDNITVSSAHTFTGQYRLLGTALFSAISASNGLGKTGATGLQTNTILYDNISTGNTRVQENFCLEDYRVPSGSYDNQGSLTSQIGVFPSSSALAATQLAVYNGYLCYPKQTLNGGNIAAGALHIPGGQPDYSTATEDRYYYRAFQNGASSVATFTMAFTGSNGFSIVKYNETLDTPNKFKAWIKIPGKTGWRDISTSAPGAGYLSGSDNLGCLAATNPTINSTTSQHPITLLNEGLSPNEYFVMRIQASGSLTANISKITITGL